MRIFLPHHSPPLSYWLEFPEVVSKSPKWSSHHSTSALHLLCPSMEQEGRHLLLHSQLIFVELTSFHSQIFTAWGNWCGGSGVGGWSVREQGSLLDCMRFSSVLLKWTGVIAAVVLSIRLGWVKSQNTFSGWELIMRQSCGCLICKIKAEFPEWVFSLNVPAKAPLFSLENPELQVSLVLIIHSQSVTATVISFLLTHNYERKPSQGAKTQRLHNTSSFLINLSFTNPEFSSSKIK